MRPTITALAAASGLLAALTAAPGPSYAAGKPEVDVYNTTASESLVAPAATLTVRLPRKATSRVTVTWRTVDGTARSGRDYKRSSGKLVFEKGQRAKKIKVPIVDDEITEATEYFYVAIASRDARVTRKRASVSIIDDDIAPYTGDVAVTSRWEQEANGFYTLETWTLTFRPKLVMADLGTAWYDDGYGEWELSGSRVLEDHRPGADCRTMERETYSGEGDFFTEPHPDTDVSGRMGNLVVRSFFPQHAGNLGLTPELHVVVSGHTAGTSYSFDGESCVPSTYENEERFAVQEAFGKVRSDRRGKVLAFDHHDVEDNSSSEGLDTYRLDVVGELAALAD